jgi:hypothetical protein
MDTMTFMAQRKQTFRYIGGLVDFTGEIGLWRRQSFCIPVPVLKLPPHVFDHAVDLISVAPFRS